MRDPEASVACWVEGDGAMVCNGMTFLLAQESPMSLFCIPQTGDKSHVNLFSFSPPVSVELLTI